MIDGDLELRIAWERHVGRSAVAGTWYASVISRHREQHRSYHDLRHVRWVVRHIGELAHGRELDDLGATIAAGFFHDAIYDPAASENEAASAALAEVALGDLEWEPERVEFCTAMIIGTAEHRWETATSIDAAVLYAADLGVLAAPPAGYSDYVRNVRREYVHVNDVDWVTGRSAVVRSFLDRDAIFAPVLGLSEWELRARGNLAAELDSLAG